MTNLIKIFKGSAIKTFTLFYRILVVFLLIPFMIRVLGTETYGLWALVSSLTSYYFLMDFGVLQAVSRYVARAIGGKKNEEIPSIISNSVVSYIFLSVLAVILSIIGLFLLKYFIPIDILNVVKILVIIVAADFAINLPLKTYQGVLTAHMDYVALSLFDIGLLTLRSVLIVVFLSRGYGIITLALINFVMNLLYHYSLYLYVIRKYKNTKFYIKLVDIKKIKELFSFGFYVFINQIGDIFRFRIGSFFVGGYIGLASVAIYSIALKILDYFMSFVYSAVSVINPLFSHYEGANDFKAMRDKLITGTRMASIVAFFILGNIIIFGKSFITNWVGREFLGAYFVLVIIAIPLSLDLAQNPGIAVLRSVNKHKFYALLNGVEGLCILSLSFILIPKFGLIGAASAVSIPMSITRLFIQPYLSCKFIDLKLKYFLKRLAPLLIFIFAFFSLSYYIFYHFSLLDYLSYIQIIVFALILAVPFFMFIFLCLFTKDEKKYIKIIYIHFIGGVFKSK